MLGSIQTFFLERSFFVENIMQGTKRLHNAFNKAEQIGRLYFLPHYHARGNTFRIYILPEGEEVIENHGINPPLNKDAVEVFGVNSGNPGWTESYGWLHAGPWVQDVETICAERETATYKEKLATDRSIEDKEKQERERVEGLLASY